MVIENMTTPLGAVPVSKAAHAAADGKTHIRPCFLDETGKPQTRNVRPIDENASPAMCAMPRSLHKTM
jgi:hypothetical protein